MAGAGGGRDRACCAAVSVYRGGARGAARRDRRRAARPRDRIGQRGAPAPGPAPRPTAGAPVRPRPHPPRPRPRSAARAGYVQIVTPEGDVAAARRASAAAARSTARRGDRARAASGEHFATDVSAARTCACSPSDAGAAAQCRWRGRSPRSTARSREHPARPRRWSAPAASRSRRRSALSSRARRSPRSRASPRRTEAIAADPDPSQRMEVERRRRARPARPSFNATLDALERSVEAQRQLVADASHELRTPIASLRANIQMLEDADRLPAAERAALRADIVGELDELTALVGDVVELARGGKPSDGARRRAPRRDRGAPRSSGPSAARRRRRDPTSTSSRPSCAASRTAISARGLEPARQRASSGARPAGRSRSTLRDGTLTVRDHGPGFADEDLPHVFERFYRADRARGMPGSRARPGDRAPGGRGPRRLREAPNARGGRGSAR